MFFIGKQVKVDGMNYDRYNDIVVPHGMISTSDSPVDALNEALCSDDFKLDDSFLIINLKNKNLAATLYTLTSCDDIIKCIVDISAYCKWDVNEQKDNCTVYLLTQWDNGYVDYADLVVASCEAEIREEYDFSMCPYEPAMTQINPILPYQLNDIFALLPQHFVDIVASEAIERLVLK
mgnify:FL=1|nr:MAG TPA: hypothetical protein [Caudoviricetes sp.]